MTEKHNPHKFAEIYGERLPYDYCSLSYINDYEFPGQHLVTEQLEFIGVGIPQEVHGKPWAGDERMRFFWRISATQPVTFETLDTRRNGKSKDT